MGHSKPNSKDALRQHIAYLEAELRDSETLSADRLQEINALKLQGERLINDTQTYKYLWANKVEELVEMTERYHIAMRDNDTRRQDICELLTQRSSLHEQIMQLAQKIKS